MASPGATVRPKASFNAESEAQALRNAMKGLGTDEKAIIGVLSSCSSQQRQEIATKYKTMFGKDLSDEFKSELTGQFENAVIALMMLPTDFDAYSLHKAIKGLGTNETILIEIMCSRTNSEIKAIKDAYKKKFDKDLEGDLIGDTSGHFQRLLISLCQGAREETTDVNASRAKEDAAALYMAGEKKLGTDESTFNVVMATRSFSQLNATFDEYKKLAGRDILESIGSEMSGDLESGMKAIVKVSRNKTDYFAERLTKSMKGLGTHDTSLIQIIVSRSEIDLEDIKRDFSRKNGKSLKEWVKEDTSGDYCSLLQAIVG